MLSSCWQPSSRQTPRCPALPQNWRPSSSCAPSSTPKRSCSPKNSPNSTNARWHASNPKSPSRATTSRRSKSKSAATNCSPFTPAVTLRWPKMPPPSCPPARHAAPASACSARTPSPVGVRPAISLSGAMSGSPPGTTSWSSITSCSKLPKSAPQAASPLTRAPPWSSSKSPCSLVQPTTAVASNWCSPAAAPPPPRPCASDPFVTPDPPSRSASAPNAPTPATSFASKTFASFPPLLSPSLAPLLTPRPPPPQAALFPRFATT